METLNYLLGYQNLKIYQDTDMFHFSLDSILLPNFVTINKKCKKILDIGTGNAVIPIILTNKTTALIDAIEIQKKSFNLAKKSIKYNNLENRINLINDNINSYYLNLETDIYDIITCNPPFFKVKEASNLNLKEEKTIARHEIFLELEDIMKVSKKLLKNNGNLALVHRPERLIEIIQLMKKYNIEPKKLQFVYPKLEKDANIILIEGTKNGLPGLKILSPMYAHEKNGDYTEQIKKYFN